MIFSWLVNSMELEIGQTYMYLSTAKQLWDAVNEMYSDLGNSLQVYELKTKIRNTTQGIIAQYQRTVEKDHVMEFLAGLNMDLDEMRGCVLGKEPLPSISKAFSLKLDEKKVVAE
ncbi:hypothetical protein CK203_100462 [Vitis vinifera]|uniref:Retrotransposon gag domain-containing protein n=1 Tax=Vitis vinifera TaxID=29760 RepID=A0A438CUW5_VITVI|nr:hypothetical protein CK203_100462 [Vitis vinifera]